MLWRCRRATAWACAPRVSGKGLPPPAHILSKACYACIDETAAACWCNSAILTLFVLHAAVFRDEVVAYWGSILTWPAILATAWLSLHHLPMILRLGTTSFLQTVALSNT